ncbi:MAG: PAAR domain-containing protein [Planctomycetales bacterium]|nr:PAAR domain-containing protein [Planctomycetales bacterium]
MGNPAARVGDKVQQNGPHCHAPIHPAAPTPAPSPHPPMPLNIIKGENSVMIGGAAAARAGDTTQPCMLSGCAPGGPGTIAMASKTVMIGMMPAARINDMTAHSACVAPIPMPAGKILPPGCKSVLIGG